MFFSNILLVVLSLALSNATLDEKTTGHQLQVLQVPNSSDLLKRRKRFVLPALAVIFASFVAGAAGVSGGAGVAEGVSSEMDAANDELDTMILRKDGVEFLPIQLIAEGDELQVVPNTSRLSKRSTILSRRRRFALPGW